MTAGSASYSMQSKSKLESISASEDTKFCPAPNDKLEEALDEKELDVKLEESV